MKNSNFHLQWSSFIVSFFFGLVAFIFYVVFSNTDRRDKIYSSLFGWVLSMFVWMLLLKFTDLGTLINNQAIQ